ESPGQFAWATLLARARDSVERELVHERRARDAELLRGARLIAGAGLERVEDLLPRALLVGVQLRLRRAHRRRRRGARRLERQVAHAELAAAREQEPALEHRLQLAHVPGPVVLGQAREQLRLELERSARRRARDRRLQQLERERRDLLPALAQGRDHQRHAVEPEEEIVAKPP